MDKMTNNKRIAQNTIVLYVRMLFLMLISLYTSRILLDSLGVIDYGIYLPLNVSLILNLEKRMKQKLLAFFP